eukprot:2367684-Lingulodinium_polyedra.AAC.1
MARAPTRRERWSTARRDNWHGIGCITSRFMMMVEDVRYGAPGLRTTCLCHPEPTTNNHRGDC